MKDGKPPRGRCSLFVGRDASTAFLTPGTLIAMSCRHYRVHAVEGPNVILDPVSW